MRLIKKDFIVMEIAYNNDIEKAFLLGALSTTLYDFEIIKEGILGVDVPSDDLQNFYAFLSATFDAFSLYI